MSTAPTTAVLPPLQPPPRQQQPLQQSQQQPQPQVPSKFSTAFVTIVVPAMLLWRLYWANRLPITDCDEVYNYWEPLHYTLFGGRNRSSGRGTALQTWEYANEYALRTYAYLEPMRLWARYVLVPLLHVGASHLPQTLRHALWKLLTDDLPVATTAQTPEQLSTTVPLFVALRATIALGTACSELVWLSALSSISPPSSKSFSPLPPGTLSHRCASPRVVLTTAALLLLCPGPNHAAGAFLPSSTWYAVYCLASACLLRHWHRTFIVVAVSATLATGWPFGALVLTPLGLRVLYKEWKYQGGMVALWNIFMWTVVVTLLVQTIVLWIDGYYYHDDPALWWRHPISATINIFHYNAVGNRDSLYGIEPLSFYLKNLLLNLNFVAPLGAGALVVYGFSQRVQWDVWTTLAPLVPWLLVTFPRPHKEERFLFPLYPLWCLSAVMVVDATINAIGRVEACLSRHKKLMPWQRIVLESLVWGPVAFLGLTRTIALSKYYTAPLHTYATLSSLILTTTKTTKTTSRHNNRVCTCGEWYRFPSSFVLVPDSPPLGFLQSNSFHGQLPQPFSTAGSRPTSLQDLQPFNDENRGDASRYARLSDCDWVVEWEGGDCRAPLPSHRIVYRHPFLNAAKTSALHRILYLPYFHERAKQQNKVVYQDYVIYQLRS